jgi:CubicO group peptidase (beta-lactamase class C family)
VLAALTADAGQGAPLAAAEPDEAQMRVAMQAYLEARNVGVAGDRPRYLNATNIARFQKRGCEPASPLPGVVCAYLLETGTTYREIRLSRHRFEFVDGHWVSRGPLRPVARLDAQRRLVEQARRDDLFFWERYLRRLDNPGEFPQPDSFYVPSQLIEGGASAPLGPAPRDALRVSGPHWQAALDWARARDTEVLAVARAGRLEHIWFAKGRDGGSLLAVRSIAKALSALAVGAALGDGALPDVRQPVGRWLPQWGDDPRGRITVEHLLTMASGLDSYRPDPDPRGRALQLAEGSDVATTALSFPRIADPGTQFGWGNAESQLLSMVVESATGASYRDYLQARIWKPMGLGTASLNVDREGRTRAFCCLRIRADDLLKIGLMLLDGGVWQGRRILPEAFVRDMFAPSAVNPYHGYQAFLGWTVGAARQAERPLIVRHELPFAEPAFYLTGYGGTTTLWLMPCSGVAILRAGRDPREWEASTLPNLLLTGRADPREGSAGHRRGSSAAVAPLWRGLCSRA